MEKAPNSHKGPAALMIIALRTKFHVYFMGSMPV